MRSAISTGILVLALVATACSQPAAAPASAPSGSAPAAPQPVAQAVAQPAPQAAAVPVSWQRPAAVAPLPADGKFEVISETPWPGEKVRVFFFGVQG